MKYAVGTVHSTNKCGDVEVIGYVNSRNITVKFLDTGTIVKTKCSRISNLKDVFRPSVYGVGYIGDADRKEYMSAYRFWSDLLKRCYRKSSLKESPTYEGCFVSENFKNFSYFKEWCNNQIGFNEEGWQLDKDILGGGKIYSEEICVFVPRMINCLFRKKDIESKGWRLTRNKHRYDAKVSVRGKQIYLGYFETKEEAVRVYRKAKAEYISSIAEEYKSKVDSRVYDKLIELKEEYLK